ncbi:MAG: TonB-dependent receptor domain-containing protein [Acidobacteriota bacterium]
MISKRLAVAWMTLAGLLVGGSLPVHAQANITGSIRGTITDDSGDFLAGATVVVIGEPLGDGRRTAVADAEGGFVINGLPVGVYSMTVTMIGYQSMELVQIVIDPDNARVFTLTLAEGLSEKITVTAERPVVDTTNTSSKEVVDATYVNKLPLISRRYQQILTLFPGVSNDEGFTLAQFHVNGSRITQNGFRLDGANINDTVTGTFGLNVNQNAIARFELNTSGFQAEYGEQSGGIANIITKSGTNEFEFLYSGFYRDDTFGSSIQGFNDLITTGDSDGDSQNNNNPRTETQQWQELYFSGPIIRNKLWFASSFQYWQEDIGSVFNDSVRTGDRYHGQFKTTWQVNPDNLFVVNFATDPSFFDNVIRDARFQEGTNFDQNQGGYFVQFRDTHTLSPSTFMENQLFIHHQYLTARPSRQGLGPFTILFKPGQPFTVQGTYPGDQDRSTDRVRLNSALTVQKGTHRIKSGLDYSFLDFTGITRVEDTVFNLDAIAQAYYGPGAMMSYTYDYRNPDKTDRTDAEVAAYIQDSWVVNEYWTVEGGVRWDRQTIIGDNNFAPRIGVAYDPVGRGKTKIYGNYGRFYDSVFTGFVDFVQNDGLTTTFAYDFGAYGSYSVSTDYDYVIDGDLETPFKDSWTVGIEQELPWNIKVGLSTTHWEGQNQLRTTLATDLSTVPSSVSLDPNADAAVILDSEGESDYRDFKVMVRKPFSHRFEVIGSYTRSRVRGDSSQEFGFENRADQRSLEFTRLSFDRPDVVNLSAFGALPGGFELTGIFRYQSGRLFSPLTPAGLIDQTVGGKNSLRMPPQRSVDLSLSKRFDMGRSQVKFTAQVFNLTDELNVIDVDRFTSSGPSFGRPVDVDFGRIVQVGLEFRY